MRALLARLEPRRSRLVAAAALGLVATAGVAGLLVGRMHTAAEPPCRDAARELAAVWNEPRRAALGAAFAAARVPRAGEAWQRVERELASYAKRWSAMRTEACEACRVRGVESEALLDRRMACLDERLRSFDALATLLLHPDADAIELAPDAARGLPALERCADARWLADGPPPPRALAAELARIEQLGPLGRVEEAATAAEKLVAAARKAGDRGMLARSLELAGLYETQAGDFDRARKTLREAALAAEAARD